MVGLEHVYEAAKSIYIEIVEGPFAVPYLIFGLIGVALVAATVSHLGSDDHGHPH